MKKHMIASALAVSLLTAGFGATASLAGPHHRNAPPPPPPAEQGGPMYQGLTPEKQEQYKAIVNDFRERTKELRDKIEAKSLELDALANAQNPNPQAVGKAAEELVSLRNQMRLERKAMSDRVAKELGVQPPAGREAGKRGWRQPGCPGMDCGEPCPYPTGGRMHRGHGPMHW